MDQNELTTLPEPAAHARTRRTFWILAGVLLVCVLLLAIRQHRKKAAKAKAVQAALSNAVPLVNVATASRGNIRHFLIALGTVTTLNSIVIRSRIDGQLMKVFFHEGQIVPAGMLLAQIDPRPAQISLTEANGQILRDRASLSQAEMDLARYEPLAEHQAIPQQQRDQQAALVQQYRGAVQTDSGQIDNAKLQLGYGRITAPISGRVGLRLVDPGNIVHASDPNGIVTITQVQPIAVVFNLAEDDLPELQRALRRDPHLPVQAWDRANQTQLAVGRILSLDNSIDSASGTLKVKASFDNRQGDLFPNEFVNIRVQTDVRTGVLLVPIAAVQRNGDAAYVYVLNPDQTAHVRLIKVGQSDESRIEIAGGLQPGDAVIIGGFEKLQDGLKVQVGPGLNLPQDGQAQ